MGSHVLQRMAYVPGSVSSEECDTSSYASRRDGAMFPGTLVSSEEQSQSHSCLEPLQH